MEYGKTSNLANKLPTPRYELPTNRGGKVCIYIN